MNEILKAPFPWFGGKRRVATEVWRNIGDVANYVEPFAGSLAVLLGRPTVPKVETINDADCFLANFWRAIAVAPEQVAKFADWPVNEADLHARHSWLINQVDFRERMKMDPDYYDPKIAGWWVWGLCIWIGDGWCSYEARQIPHLANGGKGIHRQLPHLGDGGKGINRKRPHLGDGGKGINRRLPIHGGDSFVGLMSYFNSLASRLRRVRVTCGDWSRIMGDSVTVKNGITGVFLDPPYASARDMQYAVDSATVAHDVREWAIANGDNKRLRIVLCGYEGEHEMPGNWKEWQWKANGGYASIQGRGRDNASKERIWFSPHCMKQGLFY